MTYALPKTFAPLREYLLPRLDRLEIMPCYFRSGGNIMVEDHLSNKTSVSAELTDAGVTASAESRAVSSIDRLVGGIFDLGSAWLEGVAHRRRAINDGERRLIEATVEFGLDKMSADEEFARRAFEGHFKKVARQQINKDAVVAEALEDLRRNPPSEAEALSGPSVLTDEFMGNFESYAEKASTEELRQRWGRILSSEIRKPGTFGTKVLRTTDELDPHTAAVFERISISKIRPNGLFKAPGGEIEFNDKLKLIEAGLIADAGTGNHISYFSDVMSADEQKLWYICGKKFGLGFIEGTTVNYSDDGPLRKHRGTPAVPVHILTEAGQALCSILPVDEREAYRHLALYLSQAVPNDGLIYFRIDDSGSLEPLKSDSFD